MEDRKGSAALIARRPAAPRDRPTATDGPRPRPGGGWVVSPAFDLLFLANVGWVLLLIPGAVAGGETVIDFWQVYFLTLPHRWITLMLVAADPDRRGGRGVWLAGIAALALVLVAGVWLGTRAFTCLAVVDYLWNAWHFAAQHAGVLRIYTRKVGGGVAALERYGPRVFVTYTVLRTAAWTTGWLEVAAPPWSVIRVLDLALLLVPLALAGSVLAGYRRDRTGKVAYVLSLTSLYSSLLLALTFRWPTWVIVLTTASSLFHAVEYLAVVTHYSLRRREVGSVGAFRTVARGWVAYLAIYVAALGTVGVAIERGGPTLILAWQGLNLWAAFVHYAFDGMIWKLRRPETSRALGLSPTPGGVG